MNFFNSDRTVLSRTVQYFCPRPYGPTVPIPTQVLVKRFVQIKFTVAGYENLVVCTNNHRTNKSNNLAHVRAINRTIVRPHTINRTNMSQIFGRPKRLFDLFVRFLFMQTTMKIGLVAVIIPGPY
jgi:hypothetical protein